MTDTSEIKVGADTGLEQALEESELRLRQVIDAMPHLMWIAMTTGDCIFLNQRWEEYTGIPTVDQLGYRWTAQLHEDDRVSVRAAWENARASGFDFRLNCRIRRFDGSYRWFEARGLPLRDPQGRIVKWFGTNTDVHETYEARAALAANEERLRFVTLATHDSIYDWDMRGGMTYRNDRFQKLFGAPTSAKAGDRWWESRIHPEDRKRIVDSAAVAFRARLPTWSEEYRLLRLDGSYASVNDRACLIYDTKNKPLRMIGAIADITERKRIDQSLRDTQARLVSAMEAGGLATWIWDIRADELYWDDAACRLWGRQPGEFGKLSLFAVRQLMHPVDRKRVAAASEEFSQTGVDVPVEFRTIRPDGQLQWLLIKGQIERDASGQPIRMAGVYVDITDRKRAEEAQLRTQKMEALGTLAGGIAHDFNNILLSISGNAKLAIDDLRVALPHDHSVQRNLTEISKASVRAADLVRRILTFSRQQDTQREVLQLRPLVEDALRLLRPTLSAVIEIRTDYVDSDSISTDSIQIHQVVMNLVTNAAHAIGECQGVIGIGVHAEQVDADKAREFDELPIGRYTCLTVSDTGVGIDATIIGRIFDPFFTTKQVGQGTGLGLAVVHGIVKAHGGAIVIDSTPGKGTTFRVYFPIATDQPAMPALLTPAPVRSQGEHVLYVDDEESLVFLIARVLERLGYRVTGCVDPVQALNELRAHPMDFDVLVTDLSMRGMNGFELTRAVRAIRSDLPVLLTSGYLRTEDREMAAQVGIRELILKPNTVEELGQAIDRALSEIRAVSLRGQIGVRSE